MCVTCARCGDDGNLTYDDDDDVSALWTQARVFGLRAVEASRQGKEADAFAELSPLPRPANAANKHSSRGAEMLKRLLNNEYHKHIHVPDHADMSWW